MIERLYDKYLECRGVSTDTRSIGAGNIFFALKGPHFNANRFAGKALESGALYSVIDDPQYAVNEKCIVVEDVLQTLQQLAAHHRKNLQLPFIGITGSNGKTTTKELINCVLGRKFRTHATAGNLNNHIGVPVTVLGITEETELAVIEMGANRIGEIAGLCRIARPTHGIITNIGKAHTEGFGSYEGVLRAKSELFDWLLRHDGIPFINSADPVLHNMAGRFNKPVMFPGKSDFYHCALEEIYPMVSIRTGAGRVFSTHLTGAYNFSNIAAALCIGRYFGVPDLEAEEAISDYIPANNRSQIVKKGSITIIMDAYNANPSSMEAALENIRKMPFPRKVLILGDMFELGDYTEEEHRRIGRESRDKNFRQVILCGERMKYAHEENREAVYCRDRAELTAYIKTRKFPDSLILIKGSRAMQLETIVELIIEK